MRKFLSNSQRGFTLINRGTIKGNRSGFTLIEVLLVVALLSILAGIVILAINPIKQLGDTRNVQRRIDVVTILDAAYQYDIDTGNIPATITTTSTEICKSGGTCTGLIDLTVLTTSEKYVVSIPFDPSGSSTNGTGYKIFKDADNRLTVSAPSAENGATISVSR